MARSIMRGCFTFLASQVASANVIVVPRNSFRKMANRAASGGAGARELLLYDCKADFLDAVQDWPEEKRTYCCEKSKLFCGIVGSQAETVVNDGYDCEEEFATWETTWLVGKKVWCCENQGKGCATRPDFDCSADFMDWRRSWANAKKTFCCKHEQRGCDVPGAVVVVAAQEDEHFDCEAARSNWEVEWSDAKKVWCKQPKIVSV